SESAGTWGAGGSFSGGLGGTTGGASRTRGGGAHATYTNGSTSTVSIDPSEDSWLTVLRRYTGESYALDSVSYSVEADSSLSMTEMTWESNDISRTSGETWSRGSQGSTSYGGNSSYSWGGSLSESAADHEENAFVVELRTTQWEEVNFLG